MPPSPPPTPPHVFVLTVIVALGTCAVAAGVMVPALLGDVGGWPVLAGGVIALVGALAALWVIQQRREIEH